MPTLSRRSVLSGVGILVTGAVVAAPASAQDSAALINGISSRVLALLKTGASDAQREREMSAILRESFDMNSIGRTVLGRHWSAATPEQRQRFIVAFEKAEVRAYSSRFREYSGQSLVVGKVTHHNPKDLVDAQIVQPNGQTVRLVWEVMNGKILDVTIEGVSMAITRRSDFNAYIQRNGLDGLIAELERRGS
ncbi:ABC transporter substrate-binding protein [Vineibacter terrae]|uniref:MlaC/ttg2D family ABC transporter substrate-binding protein n=1 Tax=Vineibacter terrae TaxID=2586908 RepID=UPI002E32E002|nr:ABC transporter substrate-binding protein [Vineibacter terrae]HEX2889007.1 ABC transporter substrate-binding protein [Vineibacter terrae]